MQNTNVTSVLMIRHTDVHNPTNIIYGRLARFGLSELGRDQARKVAGYLEGLPISALYSSPQLRARQTAAIINERLELDCVRDSRLLAEVLTGYEGQSNSILGGKFNFYDRPARPGDESIAMIYRRMSRFLKMARTKHPGQMVAAISHADPIMILRAGVLGKPLVIDSLHGPYYPSKGSITGFAYTESIADPIVVFRTPAEGPYETEGGSKSTTVQDTPEPDAQNGHRSRSGAATPWIPPVE